MGKQNKLHIVARLWESGRKATFLDVLFVVRGLGFEGLAAVYAGSLSRRWRAF